jgi:hypothetical protein
MAGWLVNNSDPLAPGIGATEDRGLDPILQDQAVVRRMDPAKDFDKGTFPCPILTGQRMHLSGIQSEIDVT